MHFSHLSLLQFKNYAQQSFVFEAPLVAISGANGSGKTNLLDALYFLCFTKSYFQRTDAASVQTGQQGFALEARLLLPSNEMNLKLVLRETGRKELWVDGDLQKKLSSHIGRLPAVMIAPDDVAIIADGSEERRRVLDIILSQLNPGYLEQLMRYNKVMQQRNALLRQAAAGYYNEAVLDTLDQQMAHAGNYVFEERSKFCHHFLPAVLAQYQAIAGQQTEAVDIQYQSPLQAEEFGELLWQNRQRDLMLQRCSVGVHKDDLVMTMQDHAFKSRASQGQRKSLLFALRLAEYEVLETAKGFPPLLLLDDVFEKLDAQRMENLLTKVAQNSQAQVFVTDTHADRLRHLLGNSSRPFQLLQLS